jgi:hypothetical protein
MNIGVMLNKLDKFYDKEEQLVKDIKRLTKEYQQVKEDIQMLQDMIMYQSNKSSR